MLMLFVRLGALELHLMKIGGGVRIRGMNKESEGRVRGEKRERKNKIEWLQEQIRELDCV